MYYSLENIRDIPAHPDFFKCLLYLGLFYNQLSFLGKVPKKIK